MECPRSRAFTPDDSSTRWPHRSRDASVRASTPKKNSARQHAQTLRQWSARTTSIPKWRSAPQAASCCCYQVKVFHELNATSEDPLQSLFVVSFHPLCSVSIVSLFVDCGLGILKIHRIFSSDGLNRQTVVEVGLVSLFGDVIHMCLWFVFGP